MLSHRFLIGFSLHLTQAVHGLFEMYHSPNNTSEKHLKYAHLHVFYDMKTELSIHLSFWRLEELNSQYVTG